MRPITLLIPLAGLAIWCTSAGASHQLLFTVEGLEGIEVAARDEGGMIRLIDVAEDDGLLSFAVDRGVVELCAHTLHGRLWCYYICMVIGDLTPTADAPATYPFFATPTEERVIIKWSEPPDWRFALGDAVDVVDGLIEGMNAVVYVSPGTESVLELMRDVDLSELSLYTGPLAVEGRITAIPEPAGVLLLLGGVMLSARRPHRNSHG